MKFAEKSQAAKSLAPANTGKTFKKVIDRVSCLQMIKQTFYRDARAAEHWRAAQDFRIRFDYFLVWHSLSVAAIAKAFNDSLLRRVIAITRAHRCIL